MKNSNAELARFCIGKVGTPYVMGTNGKIFTKSMYQDLVKRNPGEWFTTKRKPVIKTWVGQVTTDCHGLIEWFVREQSGEKYDTTANGAFLAATEKGEIKNIPELIGVCVRYPGHVGIYIGGGYVVEAKGFDYRRNDRHRAKCQGLSGCYAGSDFRRKGAFGRETAPDHRRQRHHLRRKHDSGRRYGRGTRYGDRRKRLAHRVGSAAFDGVPQTRNRHPRKIPQA